MDCIPGQKLAESSGEVLDIFRMRWGEKFAHELHGTHAKRLRLHHLGIDNACEHVCMDKALIVVANHYNHHRSIIVVEEGMYVLHDRQSHHTICWHMVGIILESNAGEILCSSNIITYTCCSSSVRATFPSSSPPPDSSKILLMNALSGIWMIALTFRSTVPALIHTRENNLSIKVFIAVNSH